MIQKKNLLYTIRIVALGMLFLFPSCEKERDPNEPTVTFYIADLDCNVSSILITDRSGERQMDFDNNRLIKKFIDTDKHSTNYRYVFKYPDTCKVYNREVTNNSLNYIVYVNHQELYKDYGVLNRLWTRSQITHGYSEEQHFEILINTTDQLKFIDQNNETYNYRFNDYQYVISEEFLYDNREDSIRLTTVAYTYY